MAHNTRLWTETQRRLNIVALYKIRNATIWRIRLMPEFMVQGEWHRERLEELALCDKCLRMLGEEPPPLPGG